MMTSHDPHLEWKTRGEEPVVRTPWFQVGLADVELPDVRRIDHYLFRPELLLRLEASAGLTDSVHHVYRASSARQRGEPGFETVRMEWFPLGDLPAMIASGEIRAASTAAAVLMIGHANNQ
jgi:hypothetical protein